MGSQAIQGQLWDKGSDDWAAIQEQTGNAGYQFALRFLNLNSSDNVLDIGCGSGLFSKLARATGATVSGIDASSKLIERSRIRNPGIDLHVGDMEALPFSDHTFDVVCRFNSFQYAASVKNAFQEAKRVLKDNGKLVVMIWGNKEDCEAATYLKAVGGLLPPPPPGAPGPFALTEDHQLETLLKEGGFLIVENVDINSVWDYPDLETALRGLMSAGPVARAIEHTSYEKVLETLRAAVLPYLKPNGRVVYKNKVRVVVATIENSL